MKKSIFVSIFILFIIFALDLNIVLAKKGAWWSKSFENLTDKVKNIFKGIDAQISKGKEIINKTIGMVYFKTTTFALVEKKNKKYKLIIDLDYSNNTVKKMFEFLHVKVKYRVEVHLENGEIKKRPVLGAFRRIGRKIRLHGLASKPKKVDFIVWLKGNESFPSIPGPWENIGINKFKYTVDINEIQEEIEDLDNVTPVLDVAQADEILTQVNNTNLNSVKTNFDVKKATFKILVGDDSYKVYLEKQRDLNNKTWFTTPLSGDIIGQAYNDRVDFFENKGFFLTDKDYKIVLTSDFISKKVDLNSIDVEGMLHAYVFGKFTDKNGTEKSTFLTIPIDEKNYAEFKEANLEIPALKYSKKGYTAGNSVVFYIGKEYFNIPVEEDSVLGTLKIKYKLYKVEVKRLWDLGGKNPFTSIMMSSLPGDIKGSGTWTQTFPKSGFEFAGIKDKTFYVRTYSYYHVAKMPDTVTGETAIEHHWIKHTGSPIGIARVIIYNHPTEDETSIDFSFRIVDDIPPMIEMSLKDTTKYYLTTGDSAYFKVYYHDNKTGTIARGIYVWYKKNSDTVFKKLQLNRISSTVVSKSGFSNLPVGIYANILPIPVEYDGELNLGVLAIDTSLRSDKSISFEKLDSSFEGIKDILKDYKGGNINWGVLTDKFNYKELNNDSTPTKYLCSRPYKATIYSVKVVDNDLPNILLNFYAVISRRKGGITVLTNSLRAEEDYLVNDFWHYGFLIEKAVEAGKNVVDIDELSNMEELVKEIKEKYGKFDKSVLETLTHKAFSDETTDLGKYLKEKFPVALKNEAENKAWMNKEEWDFNNVVVYTNTEYYVPIIVWDNLIKDTDAGIDSVKVEVSGFDDNYVSIADKGNNNYILLEKDDNADDEFVISGDGLMANMETFGATDLAQFSPTIVAGTQKFYAPGGKVPTIRFMFFKQPSVTPVITITAKDKTGLERVAKIKLSVQPSTAATISQLKQGRFKVRLLGVRKKIK